MIKSFSIVAVTLFALCFFPLSAQADENQVWWAAAKAEAEREGYKLLDTDGLYKLVTSESEILFVDARADYEFAAGHIPGATNLEFDLGDRMSLPDAKRTAFVDLAGQDKKRMMVIYCRSFR